MDYNVDKICKQQYGLQVIDFLQVQYYSTSWYTVYVGSLHFVHRQNV
jgi:hypothetical protein